MSLVTINLYAPDAAPRETLIVMGASAGGPTALAQVLSRLPSDFPAGIVIVQHIAPEFAASLAHWLNSQSQLQVRVAQDHEHPERGVAMIAGRAEHLVFTSPRRLAYVHDLRDKLYQPSIDLLFESAERYWTGHIIGVLLTGVGRDGAEGLRRLRRAGRHTIAQDAASSAIYGMPKAAAELGAATDILPLNCIAPRLIELIGQMTCLHV